MRTPGESTACRAANPWRQDAWMLVVSIVLLGGCVAGPGVRVDEPPPPMGAPVKVVKTGGTKVTITFQADFTGVTGEGHRFVADPQSLCRVLLASGKWSLSHVFTQEELDELKSEFIDPPANPDDVGIKVTLTAGSNDELADPLRINYVFVYEDPATNRYVMDETMVWER